MHIFLTGPLQSGKSTAIARYLAGRPEAPGGFRTHWDRAGGPADAGAAGDGGDPERCHDGAPWREGRPGRLRRGGGAVCCPPRRGGAPCC